jgi:hypothetical protein
MRKSRKFKNKLKIVGKICELSFFFMFEMFNSKVLFQSIQNDVIGQNVATNQR